MHKNIEEIINEGGAICELCDQHMLRSKGCLCSSVIFDGEKIERIKYGEGEYDTAERCHDCNVEEGQYHHYGCDNEICPICGEQLISCDCEFEYDDCE